MRNTTPESYLVALLTKREYSERKLREKALRKFPQESTTINAVIERLVADGYIDDYRYAAGFVRYCLLTTKNGYWVVYRKLQGQGIASDIARVALEEEYTLDIEIQRAQDIIQKLLQGAEQAEQERMKIQQKLRTKGYRSEAIEAALYK